MVGLAAEAPLLRRQHLFFLLLLGLFATATALKSVENTIPTNSRSFKNDPYSSSVVKIWPKAFTPDETRAIVKLMKQLPVEHDDRNDKSVKRTNFFEQAQGKELLEKGNGQYVWILQRIHGWYCDPDQNQHDGEDSSLEAFVDGIDFMLLHEFDASGFFDWHVDTKPGDATGRTNNINVMLSDHRSGEYEGGALMVGNSVIPAEQGDLYSYPASFPHKVADITGGRRHTFIIAMKSSSNIGNDNSSKSQLQKLWEQAEENHKYLCSSNPLESKFHLLYGEFLTALGRPDAEVDAKYADMYASTPQADQYLANFVEQGKALQQAGRPDEAAGYLRMAEMIRSSPVAAYIAGETTGGAKAGHSTDDL